MNVYGQLVAAQLENISAAPAGVPAGRVYFDTTLHMPRYYDDNGTAWRTIADLTSTQSLGAKTLTTCAGITLNAAAPIDWAAGNVSLGASIGANTLTIGGASSTVRIPGALSYGTATIDGDDFVLNNDAAGSGADWKITLHRPTSGMAAAATITLPVTTDTLVGLATTDTLTNKTLTSPKINENVALTTTATKLNYLTSATGTTGTASTNVVFSTSPTIATPAFTGAWTATGDLTHTSSGAIAYALNTTSTTLSAELMLKAGNGTTSAYNCYLHLFGNATTQAEWYVGLVGSTDLNFWNQTAGSTRGSCGLDGKWDFGTTTADVAHIFRNSSSGSNYVLTLRNYNTAAGSEGLYGLSIIKGSTTNTSTQRFILFNVNAGGTQSGGIAANGASAAAFVSVSDQRLKENIVGIPSQLDSICALHPVEFDFKDGSGHQTGFIAQEMQKIYPDCVSADPETTMLSIAGWDKTTARLVKALQELNAKFEAYRAAHP